MSVNDINVCETAEMAECDGEKVVTMMDVLQEQEDFEEDANAVLGASDDKNCTYSKGYIKRQAIYACLTCTDAKDDPAKRAGVCLACSLSCHENHELIELYTKRNFRCDCGNPKFNLHPCQFTPNKTEVNEDNIYNQNFSGLYCICHRPYPDPENAIEQEMIQCIICEDWLHSSHLDSVVPPSDQYTEMICKACMERNEFLHDYSDLVVNKENMDVEILNVSLELNDAAKCNGISNIVEQKDNIENNTNDLRQCDIKLQQMDEHMQEENSDVQQLSDKNDQNCTNTSEDVVNNVKQESIENEAIKQNEECDNNKHSKESIFSDTSDCDKIITNVKETTTYETKTSIQVVTNESNMNLEQECNNETEESKFSTNKNSTKLVPNAEETINNQMEGIKTATENISSSIVSETEQDNIEQIEGSKSGNEKPEEVISSSDDINNTNISESEQNNDVKIQEIKSETDVTNENKENLEYRSQEQVEEDLLLADPVEADESINKKVNDDTMNTNTDTKDSNETFNSPTKIANNKVEINLKSESECESNTEDTKIINEEIKDNTDATMSENNDNAGNKDVAADILKRKYVCETENNDSAVKKPKLESPCTRPKGVKKIHHGATFWPSNFRNKLCTCNECIKMYKDLSVLFLIDPDDTVIAYEKLGKERTDGKPVTQYEKGMAALSSLGRVQQINALTEYGKMRDKLLEFLKSFKDRKVIVKEEDIKAFFAGMKPVREPDGVYFCR